MAHAWLRVLLVAAVLCAAADSTYAQDPADVAAARERRGAVLDVPFLPQSEDLCGGAALAMVMRYWGASSVHPDDFAPFVERHLAGIRTDVLVAAARRRGWQAVALAGAPATTIRRHLDDGRPVVALVEVRPDRYHYVVIVAWTDDALVVHDPAAAPFRTMPVAEFDRAWAPAGRWAMVVVPGDTVEVSRRATDVAVPVAATSGPPPPASSPCAAGVAAAVARAQAGDRRGAELELRDLTMRCPGDASAWRELAGVRFLDRRWAEAAASAARAATLEPGDHAGQELLAASRYLEGRPGDALEAWNRVRKPGVDVVRIDGAGRTRQPIIAALVDLPPLALLTPSAFARASRRLDALPAAATTALRYTPTPDGRATVHAVVVERPPVPRGRVTWAAAAARAAIHREARVDVASPTGSGELWTAAWRWWEQRPRGYAAVALPALAPLPGITTAEVLWERASYAPGSGADVVRQERRRAALGVDDWASGRTHWTVGVAVDRWAADTFASTRAGIEWRSAADRASVGADVEAWVPAGSGRAFASVGLDARLRSTQERMRPSWSLDAGLRHATPHAPFDVWPGADVGIARAPLLRAHPLLTGGVVRGPAFGRGLAHATVEYAQPLRRQPMGTLQAATFVDLARPWGQVPGQSGAVWHVDAGIGLRAALPGRGGTLRVDLARGLRDGRTVASAGWTAPWPGR